MIGLPPISVPLVVLGAMLRAMERRFPGFTSDVQDLIEEDELQAEVVKLRGPRVTPDVLNAFKEARRWINAHRLIILALDGSKRKKKGKG